MKDTVKPGLKAERSITVDEDRTIAFMGTEGRIYGTPWLIRDIEATCRDFLLDHIDAGEESVGTKVSIEHKASTPMGVKVDIVAVVTEVNGRAVTFSVEARDAFDTLCTGTHSRFVVDAERVKARMRDKMEKLKGL